MMALIHRMTVKQYDPGENYSESSDEYHSL